MVSKFILTGTLMMMGLITLGQLLTPRLTFSAQNNGESIQFDSIKVMNRTDGWNTMIYWPDSSLSLELTKGDLMVFIGYSTNYPLNIPETDPVIEQFELFQNYPNPVKDITTFCINLPAHGRLDIIVNDLQGRIVASNDWTLEKGNHSFCFTPGRSPLYFLTSRWNGKSHTIKIITDGSQFADNCKIGYSGCTYAKHSLKAYSPQDGKFVESGIISSPHNDTSFTFQFASNIPCPGSPSVDYQGQVYHTVQIFGQCWLKENLNIGTMISSQNAQSDNGVIEKYCYNNDASKCDLYGGLYQWRESMQYDSLACARGICPQGWHIPDDEEWKVLEGAVDSQFGVGDLLWDINYAFRGFDAGTNLKSTSGWNYGGNGNDAFGFAAIPGGACYQDNIFINKGYNGMWWTSTHNNNCTSAMNIYLDYQHSDISQSYNMQDVAFSVRCLRDQ